MQEVIYAHDAAGPVRKGKVRLPQVQEQEGGPADGGLLYRHRQEELVLCKVVRGPLSLVPQSLGSWLLGCGPLIVANGSQPNVRRGRTKNDEGLRDVTTDSGQLTTDKG